MGAPEDGAHRSKMSKGAVDIAASQQKQPQIDYAVPTTSGGWLKAGTGEPLAPHAIQKSRRTWGGDFCSVAEREPGTANFAVLTRSDWTTRSGGDPAVEIRRYGNLRLRLPCPRDQRSWPLISRRSGPALMPRRASRRSCPRPRKARISRTSQLRRLPRAGRRPLRRACRATEERRS